MLTSSFLIPKDPKWIPNIEIDKKEDNPKIGKRNEWKYNVPFLVRKLCQKLIHDHIFFTIIWFYINLLRVNVKPLLNIKATIENIWRNAQERSQLTSQQWKDLTWSIFEER